MAKIPVEFQRKPKLSKNFFGALGDFWDTSKRMGIPDTSKKIGDHMFDVFVERMFTGVSFWWVK